MYLREVEYMLKIAEEQNISRAAEKLFITPSALNQQLTRLEADLGIELFHRGRNGCTPTEAGAIYLNGAQDILKIRKDVYRQLQDISSRKTGKITVGFPLERGASAFTSIYPLFHREYPEISISITETSVRQQQMLISADKIDFGFMTLRDSQKTDDEYIPITKEELVVILPSTHPLCSRAKAGKGPYPELDPSLLKDESFAMMYRNSTVYECVEEILHAAGVVPNILFETPRAITIMEMVASNMCCGIIPDSPATPRLPNVSFFCLPDHPSWSIFACYRKGTHLPKSSRRFIELAAEYWVNAENSLHPKK